MAEPVYTASMLTTSSSTTQYIMLGSVKGATNDRARVKRIAIFTDSANATAGGIGLAWSTALSATSIVNGGTFTAHDVGDPAATATTITGATTLATNSGAAGVFMRFTHPGSGGAGIIWGENELGPLVMATGATAARGELCFVNLKAAAPALYHITVTLTNAV